ncbi:STAS domain-containing protein [Crocinitomix catalasitica]|nr:STAS domain-containing protein [Crocinitomix catalasitica]
MSLELSTVTHPNCVEIILDGSALSDHEFMELNDLVDELIDQHSVNLVLNLHGVRLLNSLGINTLIKVFTKCRNAAGEMYIVNISDKINQVLLLTKLNTVLNIATSLEEATENFNQ